MKSRTDTPTRYVLIILFGPLGCVGADAVCGVARGLGTFVDVETGLSITLKSVVTVTIKGAIGVSTDGVGGAGAYAQGALVDVLALAIVVPGSASAAAAREVAGCVDALLSKWAGCGVIALIDVDAASVILLKFLKLLFILKMVTIVGFMLDIRFYKTSLS